MDIAASIQKITEKIMLRMAAHAHKITGYKNLCLAGGVALNCVSNGKILREGPFENIWIQPAAGDAGGALGAAQFVWHQLLENPRKVRQPDYQTGSYLGPNFDDDEIGKFLKEQGAEYTQAESDEQLCREVAALMANEKVVGWFQGRMEFGPRALGARSILGDARSRAMQKVMNLKIKFRESFRPFAPCVLRNRVDEYFEMRSNEDSPYMLLVADVVEEKRSGNTDELKAIRGLDKLPIERSEIQAVTHVDYSARVQTVDEQRNPLYHNLIKEFDAITGCPVIINTSFNVRGEPIVCTPQDSYRVFHFTNMDVLVLGRCILLKEKQAQVEQVDIEDHLAQFALD
jgi:carbamoyltransferase